MKFSVIFNSFALEHNRHPVQTTESGPEGTGNVPESFLKVSLPVLPNDKETDAQQEQVQWTGLHDLRFMFPKKCPSKVVLTKKEESRKT